MEKANKEMKLTLRSRLNIAISESMNDGVFMYLIEYKGLIPDLENLLDNGILSLKLLEAMRLHLGLGINLEWILLGKGDVVSWYKRWNEKWDEWRALLKENEVLKDKLSKLQGGREPEPMKGKVIKVNFK